MGYYKKQCVVIIPAAKRQQFNDILQKQGYGPNNLREGVVGKNENNKNAVPTHYVMDCAADEGLSAAIELARKGITGSVSEAQYKFEKDTATKAKLTKDGLLEKNNLKSKDKIK